jgi:hypothetical protein
MPAKEYNSGKHIDDIIDRTDCSIHYAAQGFPCFVVRYGNGKNEDGPGICGPRIKKAGFTGTIHPSSLSRSVTKQQASPRR